MMVCQCPTTLLLPLLLLVNGGCLFLLQQPTSAAPVTATAEADAFLAVFKKWKIASMINWNATDDVCSGGALDNSTTVVDSDDAPAIRCDCSDDNGTTCHITQLSVRRLDIVGEIPNELWNLTFLTHLRMSINYLIGSVPPSIGNLKKLQKLHLSYNALSGKLPKELGQLTGLNLLSFTINNFSGSLPSEIGNIVGLRWLYIASSGVSGPIPSSFANLVNLTTFWASDNELNGTIPDFIGTWSQLKDLRLQGNSFVGTIPSSFSNLTALYNLTIGDLSNGSSSLAFITNLTSLNILVLRNINLSDTIPSGIGGLTNLTYLDLSFNSIRGRIPDALFSLGYLQYLFLGNNKLTGSLPAKKSASLINIDVSYNELSGEIPSWVNDQNLQINLVVNNFTLTNSNALPSGLNCLQNNFPCYHGSPRHSSFAVKCGGRSIKTSDGIVYEIENEILGPATYYVDDVNSWAVSNAGYFLDSDSALYTTSSSSSFSNSSDLEIFQTARLSPSSLRYYGLGLENGNYTVLLHFAELIIQNGKAGKSLGRRVFDIYIQGHLAAKNFDIRKEAGGKSFSAVTKKFSAQVTSNYLEIHLFWAGKGTCCVPVDGTYGPSISAISVISNFVPTVSSERQHSSKHKTGLVLAIALPFGCIFLLFLVPCYAIQMDRRLREARHKGVTAGIATVVLVFDCYWLYQMLKRRKDKKRRAMNFARHGGLLLQEVASSDCVVKKTQIFTARDLEKATDHFSQSRIIGRGGQGIVYKGILADGRFVAIKKSNMVDQDQSQKFINEVAILSQVNHRNVVKLLGCCLETEVPLLVYEFVPNGTLFQHLHNPNGDFRMTWQMRLQVAVESAGALAYLHSSSSVPIYHRDVKSSNILLDEKYRAKVSDFGISRTICIEDQSHLTTCVQGTMGYLDPEYFRSHQFSDKSDVYSFGVVLVELLTGKKAFGASNSGDRKVLVTEFLEVMESSRFFDILDPRILEEAQEGELLAVAKLATRCLNMNGKQRPTMREVAMTLESIRSFPVANPIEEEDFLEIYSATNETSNLNSFF